MFRKLPKASSDSYGEWQALQRNPNTENGLFTQRLATEEVLKKTPRKTLCLTRCIKNKYAYLAMAFLIVLAKRFTPSTICSSVE